MGDINAKNEAWGGSEHDKRGQDLMQWALLNKCTVENNADSEPTFETVRSKGWVDVTITKGVQVVDWEV